MYVSYRGVVNSTFSCLIVKVMYGIKLGGKDDRSIALMESGTQSIQAFSPGRFLVHYVPALQYVPYWMPVAGPQLRELDGWRSDAHEVKDALFARFRDAMVSICTRVAHQ